MDRMQIVEHLIESIAHIFGETVGVTSESCITGPFEMLVFQFNEHPVKIFVHRETEIGIYYNCSTSYYFSGALDKVKNQLKFLREHAKLGNS